MSKYSRPTAEELETALPTCIPLFGAWALNAIGHRIYCKCPPLKPYSSYKTVWDSLQTAQNTCTHIHFLIRFSCEKMLKVTEPWLFLLHCKSHLRCLLSWAIFASDDFLIQKHSPVLVKLIPVSKYLHSNVQCIIRSIQFEIITHEIRS